MTSRWFKVADFNCKDGTPYPPEWVDSRLAELCSQLDIIRDVWGGPLIVVSGYRTPKWNAEKGGVDHSQHLEGMAVDMRPRFSLLESREEACRRLYVQILHQLTRGSIPSVGGVGLYREWVHVDTRARPPSGHVAHWFGTGIGSEVA